MHDDLVETREEVLLLQSYLYVWFFLDCNSFMFPSIVSVYYERTSLCFVYACLGPYVADFHEELFTWICFARCMYRHGSVYSSLALPFMRGWWWWVAVYSTDTGRSWGPHDPHPRVTRVCALALLKSLSYRSSWYKKLKKGLYYFSGAFVHTTVRDYEIEI